MFSLDENQQNKINKWAEAIDKKVAEQQGRPDAYYGAIGGSLTYSFTPTSIGVVITVKHGLTNEIIDVSDYEEW